MRSCGSTAGDVGEKAKPGVGLDIMIESALNSINHDQPDFFRIQANQTRQITNCGGLLYLHGPPSRLIGKQLSKNFNINCHNAS